MNMVVYSCESTEQRWKWNVFSCARAGLEALQKFTTTKFWAVLIAVCLLIKHLHIF